MMINFAMSESNKTTFDFFMKFLPLDSISITLEGLAYITIFTSILEKHEGKFDWEDKSLQKFLHTNDIFFKDKNSNIHESNNIYFTFGIDKAYGFLNHIKNALINGLVFDTGFDYEIWDIEPSVGIGIESSLKHKKEILTQIAPSQITMRGIIRKYLFWQFITTVIKTNKNINCK